MTNAGATFTIGAAAASVIMTDTCGTYTSLAFAATGAVTGVSGANLGTPAFTSTPARAPRAAERAGGLARRAGGHGRLHGSCLLRRQPGLRGGQHGCHADDQPKGRDGDNQNAGGTHGQSDPSPLTAADLSRFCQRRDHGDLHRAAGEDVGSYAITTTLAGPSVKLGDYNVTNTGATFTISPATPTVTVVDASGMYTSLAFAATGDVTGVGGTNLGCRCLHIFRGRTPRRRTWTG